VPVLLRLMDQLHQEGGAGAGGGGSVGGGGGGGGGMPVAQAVGGGEGGAYVDPSDPSRVLVDAPLATGMGTMPMVGL
jgi:hypothetical protein